MHLHNHTEYSMLDGAAKIKPMLAEAQRLDMPAIGMTDHGNMFGASEFYNGATEAGIKPIIGVEAYIAPGSRFDTKRMLWGDPSQKCDDVSGSGSYTHMTMVAENATGLRNLFKLSSLASFEGQLGKWSRMDAELIAEHAEGIIATTGCPSGEVQTRLRLGHDREALEAAAKWREIFGPENFFLELMDHGLDIERRVREGLLEIGRSSASRRWPPTTATTSPATPPTTTRRCCACRPARRCPTPTGSSSTATATTSSRRPRCARCGTTRCPARATPRC